MENNNENTTSNVKSRAEFEKDYLFLRQTIGSFCDKYKDVIMGFTVRNSIVAHPTIEKEFGVSIPSFDVYPICSGEILDRDYI